MKNILMLIIMMIALPCAYAYQYTGDTMDALDIEVDPDSFTVLSRFIGTTHGVPLVGDMNNDGVDEIMVLDGQTLEFYNGELLTPLDNGSFASVNIQCNGTYSNPVLFDWDDDGFIEWMIICENYDILQVVEYNATGVFLKFNHSLTNLTHDNAVTEPASHGEMILRCSDASNNCGIAYTRNSVASPFSSVNFASFNWSFVSSGQLPSHDTGIQVNVNGDANEFYCMPHIKTMEIGDYDGDGQEEWVFSYVLFNDGADSTVYMEYVAILTNLTLQHEAQISFDIDTYTPTDCRQSNFGRVLTPPKLGNFDSTVGLETLIAVSIDEGDDEFYLRGYDSSQSELGGLFKGFPEIVNADGQIISNIAQVDFFDDTVDGRDFCVMGYVQAENLVNILCASFDNDKGREHIFPVTSTIDIGYDDQHMLIHPIEFLDNGIDRMELITPLGIYGFEDGIDILSFYTPLDYDEVEVMSFADTGSGAYIVADFENTGFGDIIGLSANHLRLYEDGFTREGAVIGDITVNPSHQAVWKVNTTVSISPFVNDSDSDDVCVQVFLYYQDDNQQLVNWTCGSGAGKGSEFTAFFTANKTITNGKIFIRANSTDFPSTFDETTGVFTVGFEGVEFNEIIGTIVNGGDPVTPAGSVDVDGDGIPDTQTSSGNVIDTFVEPITESSGLGAGIVWLVLMLIVAGAIWYYKEHNKQVNIDAYAWYMIAGVEVALFIIGVSLGYISVGLLIGLLVVGILVGVIAFRRRTSFGGGVNNG